MLLVVTASGGCQWVFGDFEFRPEDGTGGTNGAGGVSATGGSVAVGGASECAPEGRHQCVDSQPQTCANGAWTNVGSRCSAEGLCNVTTGGCDVCAADTLSCNADKTAVVICNANHDGWTVTKTCETGTFCDPAKAGVCVVCTLDQATCTDATTKRSCKGDQSGFVEAACPGGLPCITVSSTQGYCAECVKGSLPSCSTNGNVASCGNDQRWVFTSCDHGCNAGTATTGAVCNP
jgi:hypothetical protein